MQSDLKNIKAGNFSKLTAFITCSGTNMPALYRIVNDAIYESIIEKQVTVKWDIVEIEKDLNFESFHRALILRLIRKVHIPLQIVL